MLAYFFVSCGAIILSYSFALSYRFGHNHRKFVGQIYYAIPILISFFIIGYLAFITIRLTGRSFIYNDDLVSLIFFFGAVFVLLIININNRLMNSLLKSNDLIVKTNQALEKNNLELNEQKDRLAESEKKLQKRSDELLKTMEDFYTLRLNLEEKSDGSAKKDFSAENEVVKKRIDELKK